VNYFLISSEICVYIFHFVLLVYFLNIQGVIESFTDILTTNYWLHLELEKNI
jgi:hypothetical protein